jgi:uncharacterized membrane protein
VLTGINLAFSLVSVRACYAWYGAGFAASCLLAVLTSLYFLTEQLYNLEFWTFSSIPVVGRRTGRALRARPGGLFGRYNPVEKHDAT